GPPYYARQDEARPPSCDPARRAMSAQRLGPWLLEQELGRGGMGGVWRARADTPPAGCPDVAAVKVLSPELAAHPRLPARVQPEIEVLGRLDHPGIVKLYGHGVEAGRPFFAMEYVAGPSLQAVLQKRGRLTWQEVVELGLLLTQGLKHAHDRGIVHRDLKPSN